MNKIEREDKLFLFADDMELYTRTPKFHQKIPEMMNNFSIMAG